MLHVGDGAVRAFNGDMANSQTRPGRFQEGASSGALTALRLGVGVIFIVHGGMKLLDYWGTVSSFSSLGIPVPNFAVSFAILGELVGGMGLVLGFLTRIAALGSLVVMLGAIGYAHAGNGLLARNGGWEYPLTLLLVALYFVTRGAGPFSVDAWIARRRLERRGALAGEKRAVPNVDTSPSYGPHRGRA